MSKLNDYWQDRAKQAINSEMLADAQKVAEIQRIVTMMYADIYKSMLAYYGKLATAQGIDWKSAKQIADTFDVQAFQEQAKALVENKDFSDKANKLLKQYNTSMYISREKLLKQQLGMLVTKAYAEQENVINDHLQESVERTLEHQSGILGKDVKVKQTDINAIINANFGNVNWSTRLWDNQDELQSDVERMASNVVLRGRHPNEFVPEIRKKQDQTVNNTKRILITEAARVQTEAQKLHYMETLGEDAQYQFIAKLDERTSKVCRHNNDRIFKVKDMVAGINAPPMHPNCRSTTAPYVGNWRDKFFKDRKGKYSLKDDDIAEVIDTDVPVEVEPEPVVKQEPKPIKPKHNTPIISEQLNAFIGDEQSQEYADLFKQSKDLEGFEDYTKLYNYFADKHKFKHSLNACYKINDESINMHRENLGEREKLYDDEWQSGFDVLTHETSHFLDHQIQKAISGSRLGDSKHSPYFSGNVHDGNSLSDIIKQEIADNTKAILQEMKEEHKAKGEGRAPRIFDARREYEKRILSSYSPREYSSLSDLMGGATKNKMYLGIGHSKGYWNRDDHLSAEAFAEFSEIYSDPKALLLIKTELPKSYEFYLKLLKIAVEALNID